MRFLGAEGDVCFLGDVVVAVSSFCVMIGSVGGGGTLVSTGRQISGISATAAAVATTAEEAVEVPSIRTITGAGASR